MDIVRLLLDRGASVDAADYVSQPTHLAAPPSSLHAASGPMPQRIECGWARRPAGWVVVAAWHWCAAGRFAGGCALGRGCASLQDGNTSLICASVHGHVDIVRMLLDRGASVDATDRVSHHAFPRNGAEQLSVIRRSFASPIPGLVFTSL